VSAIAAIRGSEALRTAWSVFLWTRGAVLLVAVFAALSFGPATGGLAARNAHTFDTPALSQPLGGFGDVVLAPLTRWDAVWYLRIADGGYADSDVRAAFFPLYPSLVRALGWAGGGSPGARLVASFAISLACFLAALALFHRLVTLELGARFARPALLLLAVFPGALYFGAPYSESLFLLCSVGAFLAARQERWALAGLAGGAAAATRSAGVLLLVPLAILWWQSGRSRRLGDAAWLALVPLGLLAYVLWLALAEGDGTRFLQVQDAWSRELTWPLGGAWDGFTAALDGVRQLLSGSRSPVYFEVAAGDPFRIAAINLMLFGFLVFGVAACVGIFRRLGLAYGAWVAVALLLPLTFPVVPQPLMSLPRFLAVLFPIFMWLALWCEERGVTDRVLVASALGLGLFTTQYATWHWIA
jgi:mannosyltransferase PIG-V